jgi:O-antigen/teichoic acid export membrane protein
LFALNFIANIHKSLYVAFLKGKYSEESIAVNQFGILALTGLACLFFKNFSIENKLIAISLINGIFCLLVNIFYTVRFFKMEQLNLRAAAIKPPGFLKDILNLGFKFMIIQVSTLFIFSFDNYIISNAFSPIEVVPYEIVNKLFQLPVLIIFAMLSPLWSMFATDYLNKNRVGLLLIFKRFNLIFISISVAILLLSLLTPIIIPFWIKTPIELPKYLVLIVGIVTCFKIFTSFYIFFLSGIGNLNKYILLLLASLLLKIPLSYLFIKLDFGISSVVLSTLLLLVFWMVLLPYQSYSLVYKIKKNE